MIDLMIVARLIGAKVRNWFRPAAPAAPSAPHGAAPSPELARLSRKQRHEQHLARIGTITHSGIGERQRARRRKRTTKRQQHVLPRG